jgi:hypothetical protein
VRLPSYDRWLLVGGAIFAAGVLVAFSWFIYVHEALGASFWAWPGSVGVAGTGVGFALLVFGFFKPTEEKMSSGTEQSNSEEENSAPVGERIGYRLSGRAKSKTRNAYIRNQDVAFDVSDDATLDDEGTTIE